MSFNKIIEIGLGVVVGNFILKGFYILVEGLFRYV